MDLAEQQDVGTGPQAVGPSAAAETGDDLAGAVADDGVDVRRRSGDQPHLAHLAVHLDDSAARRGGEVVLTPVGEVRGKPRPIDLFETRTSLEVAGVAHEADCRNPHRRRQRRRIRIVTILSPVERCRSEPPTDAFGRTAAG
ncbi:MAG: hypothetical protein R2690_07225 [Acidimicrobiales bacterium]